MQMKKGINVGKVFQQVNTYFRAHHGLSDIDYRVVGRIRSNKEEIKFGLKKLCETKVITIPMAVVRQGKNILIDFLVHEHLHLLQHRHRKLTFGKGATIKWCDVPYKLGHNVNFLGYYYKSGEVKTSYPPWERDTEIVQEMIVNKIREMYG